jgi:hypothetical protein
MAKLAQLPTPMRPMGNGHAAADAATESANRRRDLAKQQADIKKNARSAAKTQQLAERLGTAT